MRLGLKLSEYMSCDHQSLQGSEAQAAQNLVIHIVGKGGRLGWMRRKSC